MVKPQLADTNKKEPRWLNHYTRHVRFLRILSQVLPKMATLFVTVQLCLYSRLTNCIFIPCVCFYVYRLWKASLHLHGNWGKNKTKIFSGCCQHGLIMVVIAAAFLSTCCIKLIFFKNTIMENC